KYPAKNGISNLVMVIFLVEPDLADELYFIVQIFILIEYFIPYHNQMAFQGNYIEGDDVLKMVQLFQVVDIGFVIDFQPGSSITDKKFFVFDAQAIRFIHWVLDCQLRVSDVRNVHDEQSTFGRSTPTA